MMQGLNPMEQGNLMNPAAPETATPGTMPTGANYGGAQQGANLGATPGSANQASVQQGATPGAMQAAAANVTPQRGKFRTASVFSERQKSYSFSPELSARMTSIARARGMLAGQGINVYLSNNAALLQGTVRTPNDRDALANVLGLEPEVQRIDNRLQVNAAGN
jgi:hypothetical protein